ncbi:hypothetical protein [Streptomyces griseus]|uniref:hypothetical protein n=1 Tax=Streptomyces griseus TaxID=1911 RepID=UPI0034E0A3DC
MSWTASSLLSAITDRLRPITSWRSRPKRSRSSATASRALRSRERSSSWTTRSSQEEKPQAEA